MRRDSTPSKPKAAIFRTTATVTAIAREVVNASCTLRFSRAVRWTTPTLGRASLVAGELVLVLVLCFYRLNPDDEWQWESIGYRTGHIAVAQLPLVVLLAGKRSIVGYLVGSSYERLNWIHRWTARILFLTVTIHMGYWFADWARYDYIHKKMTTDVIVKRGFAAWVILLWITLSTLAPARRWNYELFFIQHVATFVGFFAAVYLHLPRDDKFWVWISVGFFLFDRCARVLMTIFTNVSVFRKSPRQGGFWACKATFEPLTSDMTKVVIRNPPISWEPGQHLFLSCHSVVPLQSHPFTIASLPQDGRLELLIKSKKGGTRGFLEYATKNQGLPLPNEDSSRRPDRVVTIEGPYGQIRPLRQFDSVFLMAGGSGCTFTIPLMRDLVSCWMKTAPALSDPRGHQALSFPGAVTRYIRFIWVVKSRQQFDWFSGQLLAVKQDVQNLRDAGHSVEMEATIYITCDHRLVSGNAADQRTERDFAHGEAKQASIDTTLNPSLEKLKASDYEITSIHSQPSNSEERDFPSTTCGTDGKCCCTNAIEEDEITSSQIQECQCHHETADIKAVNKESIRETFTEHATAVDISRPPADRGKASESLNTAVLSGRPQSRNLIQRTLERALGESAVVVCGPHDMVTEVRQSVVSLSDERAVHKGTGAQGIYFHAESFEL